MKKVNQYLNQVATIDEVGRKYKVTVDCPKSPFTQTLITSMAGQAGVNKKDFYKILSRL